MQDDEDIGNDCEAPVAAGTIPIELLDVADEAIVDAIQDIERYERTARSQHSKSIGRSGRSSSPGMHAPWSPTCSLLRMWFPYPTLNCGKLLHMCHSTSWEAQKPKHAYPCVVRSGPWSLQVSWMEYPGMHTFQARRTFSGGRHNSLPVHSPSFSIPTMGSACGFYRQKQMRCANVCIGCGTRRFGAVSRTTQCINDSPQCTRASRWPVSRFVPFSPKGTGAP